jgi:hypothetical protein
LEFWEKIAPAYPATIRCFTARIVERDSRGNVRFPWGLAPQAGFGTAGAERSEVLRFPRESLGCQPDHLARRTGRFPQLAHPGSRLRSMIFGPFCRLRSQFGPATISVRCDPCSASDLHSLDVLVHLPQVTQ